MKIFDREKLEQLKQRTRTTRFWLETTRLT